MTNAKKYTPLLIIILFLAIVFGLSMTAKAQDFYGEGNVLIAVDMAPYAENEEVSYPEGTMGTLVWGEDAPTGVSTRPDFSNHGYEASQEAVLPRAPDYDIETTYYVGQKFFFPYVGDIIFSDVEMQWFSADSLPPEVFCRNGEPGFLIHTSHVKTENGVTQYKLPYVASEDGEVYPAVDFLEIECAAVTEKSTIWQYTGKACSNRPDFDPADYVGAIELTEEDIRFFADACDEAYTVQERIYGDPRWEDRRGDCDGKAAYLAMNLRVVYEEANAFFCQTNTELGGFDCLVISVDLLPEQSTASQEAKDYFAGTLAHELNHYIVTGCIGHEAESWSMWIGEAFAEYAIYAVRPDSTEYLTGHHYITSDCSRLRMIPGMLWSYDCSDAYPGFVGMVYLLGPYFLRYIERQTIGQTDGRLWTEYFAQRTPSGSITGVELDAYLKDTTGEGLDAWMAQFMAAVVVGASDGPYCMGEETVTAAYRIDPHLFFRPCEEYGTGLSYDGAADEAIRDYYEMYFGSCGVAGGGTVYAWRNDTGGKIAITGAEDRWYFFTAEMALPDECELIEIDSAEEFRKIGSDPAYPLSGRYRMTADIDLGGAEEDPWMPIGMYDATFTGEFDGNGHTVRGLYINDPNGSYQGLFGVIAGNGSIKDLTVYGSVTGGDYVGGIIGWMNGGSALGCTSYVTVSGSRAVGGIAGINHFGAMENCTASGTVAGVEYIGGVLGYSEYSDISDCSGNGTVTGENEIGGVAGFNYYSAISECRNEGAVTGELDVGGVVGTMYGDSALLDCCNTGTVTGNKRVGGLVGDGWGGVPAVYYSYSYQHDLPLVGEEYEGTVTASFARSDTETGDGYLTTAAFSNPASFPGWDFENVWSLDNGVRPILRNNPETLYVDDGGDDTPVTPVTPVTPAKEEIDVAETFTDVSEDDWYYEAVDWAVNEGLMNGVGEDAFDPNGTGTRAMVVTMLWRMAGEPKAGDSEFTDLDENSWYELAVNWAAETGAVLGTSEDTFSPNEPITREQLAVILYRYAQSKGLGFTGDWAFRLDYSDADQISDYAYEAMCWMTMHGVINGMGDGTVAPQSEATRAQIAAMFMRFSEEIS